MVSELFVVCYPTMDAAKRAVEVGQRLEAEGLLHVEDAGYMTRDADGVIAVYPRTNRRLRRTALGAFWGGLLGQVFGRPLLGAGLGAAGAALARQRTGEGIDEGFVRELTTRLAPDSSAVYALVRRFGPDRVLSAPEKVLPVFGQFGGTVLHTSVSTELEERFQQALDEAHQKASALRSATLTPPARRGRRVVRGKRGMLAAASSE